jgi:NAD(P)-dependent dehydrogenase (short-subunit alcohol dehydrogenase family)
MSADFILHPEPREALGGLDLLVNNAGVEAPFELVDMPLEEWNGFV